MNKTAIITGSSRGIGRGTAIKLAEAGYNVCINYIKRTDLADELVKELENKGCRSIAFQADVADRKQVDAMVAKVADTFGPIDLLVNNAGVAGQALFQDVTDEMWDRYFGTNLVQGILYRQYSRE